jgi:pimeloyl-ACP methyl ester carboxylesterase
MRLARGRTRAAHSAAVVAILCMTDLAGVALPGAQFYVSQRTRLHYADWGNSTAAPLILVHGGRDHCRSWDAVAQALRADWHVIAPDLRGHGDSAWSSDGNYSMAAYVFDLAQLIHVLGTGPVNIIGHSLGGHIALRFAGLYPQALNRLVVMEGLGLAPQLLAAREARDFGERARSWIEQKRALIARAPRRYGCVAEAAARLRLANPRLSPLKAQELTVHGVKENADGSYSWKYDEHVRLDPPADLTGTQQQILWGRITCPTLLAYGRLSWASNPAIDGRAGFFKNSTVTLFDAAGHWMHHDCLDQFVSECRRFLSA